MIEFRQKLYGAGVAMIASTGLSMVQGGIQNKKNAAQQEAFQEEQSRLQRQQNKALEKIAASGDQNKAQQVGQVMQQKSYAAVNPTMLQKGGQIVYDFARGIGGKKVAKVVGSGLAMGTGMALGSYAIDKAIQADRRKITGGAPLPTPQKSPEEKAKEKKKKIAKLATAGALTAGTIIAARKGALGKGFQNLSKGLNSAGEKINIKSFKGFAQSGKHHFKEGIGIKTINPTKQEIAAAKAAGQKLKPRTKFSPGPLLSGVGFAGLFALPYIGERKQLKEQAAAQQQQRTYAEEEYQQPRKKGSVLKKLAIGTAATAATVATLRRVGPAGIRKGINDMYMTYGKKFAGANGTGKLGNWMMKSGSKEYGKAVVKARNSALQKQIKAGQRAAKGGSIIDKIKHNDLEALIKTGEKASRTATNLKLDASKIGAARLEKIKSGNYATRKVGQTALEKIGGIFGIKKQTSQNFLNKMMNTNPQAGTVYSKEAQDAARFLKDHRRLVAGGAIGVGSLAWKPWTWGDSATKSVLSKVDKNAFAYEKSKEQQVPEE